MNDVSITEGSGVKVETLQQADADQSHRQVMHMADFKVALQLAINQLLNPIYVDPSARVRISLENIAGALTLATITTVGTVTTVSTVTTVNSVTNLAQIGAVKADSFIMDQMMNMWANAMRGQIV